MVNNMKQLFEFCFDKDNFEIFIKCNAWVVLAVLALLFIPFLKLFNYIFKSKTSKTIPVEMTFNVGKVGTIKYQIVRNLQNIEIAHKIYIELITRKAAIEIEENDIIIEVYNSWFTLFQTTREELKKLSGQSLIDNSSSAELIKIVTDILNFGLRPHLTEYQAKFRKWYSEELADPTNKGKTPQEIQQKYPNIQELLVSIKQVNALLIQYSEQLKKIQQADEK